MILRFEGEGFTKLLLEQVAQPNRIEREGTITHYWIRNSNIEILLDENPEAPRILVTGDDSILVDSSGIHVDSLSKAYVSQIINQELTRSGFPSEMKLVRWDMDWDPQCRIREGLLNDALREIIKRICTYERTEYNHKLFADQDTAGYFNFSNGNRAGIKELQDKCPGLLAFLKEYCEDRQEEFKQLAAEDPTVLKTDWSKPHNLMAEMRVFIMERYGLTKSGWKVMLLLKNEQRGKWLLNDAKPIGFATVLEAIAEHPKHKFPRVTAMRAIKAMQERLYGYNRRRAGEVNLRDSSEHNLYKQLVKEALKHSTTSKHIGHWVSLEWDQVADWFLATGMQMQNLNKQQLNASWTWFVRHAQAWHDELQTNETLARMARDHRENLTWTSELEAHTLKEFEFIPCLSSMDLVLEGQEQQHCVGGSAYSTRSHEGTCRIWSIRSAESGARLATLELNVNKLDGYRWHRGQLKGKCNTEPTPEVVKAADELVRRYNQAVQTRVAAEQEAAMLVAEIHAASADETLRKKLQAKLLRRMKREASGLSVTIPPQELELLEQMGISLVVPEPELLSVA